MTQALKSPKYKFQGFERNIRRRRVLEQFSKIILNYLFRNVAFVDKRDRVRTIPTIIQKQMSNKLKIGTKTINIAIRNFLDTLVRINQFVEENGHFAYSKNPSIIVQTYLHKLYRLAPVFDYKRARVNAKILRKKLDAHCFWPKASTQVAVVIYITDKLDASQENKLLQTNLRSFCNSSAYAFHRTRNKIGLN